MPFLRDFSFSVEGDHDGDGLSEFVLSSVFVGRGFESDVCFSVEGDCLEDVLEVFLKLFEYLGQGVVFVCLKLVQHFFDIFFDLF